MKLSEAIRKGAKIRPQCFGYSFGKNEDGVLCSCAWGAAHEAIFGKPEIDQITGAIMYQTHKSVVTTSVENPVTKKSYELASVITDLNDHAKWTREDIADWVESLGF